LNLLRVLSMHQADLIKPLLFVGTELADAEIAPFANVRGVDVVRIPALNPRREARALVTAQNKLAFRKWDVRAAGADPQTDSVAQALRAEILGIRALDPLAGGVTHAP
jgi:hypothetical protein